MTGGKHPRTLCIAGMHRSGTSLLAMWLNKCGIEFANDHLIGPQRFNKNGHFEDARIVNLHQQFIEDFIPRSKGWIVTRNVDIVFNEQHEDVARQIIWSYGVSSDLWGWKDPRTLLAFKSWKVLLPDLKMIMVWRSAGAVVDSLIRRSRGTTNNSAKVNVLKAIQSWKIYNKKIIEFCHLFPQDTLLFPLMKCIQQDKEVVNIINSKFKLNLNEVSISEFYDRHLLATSESNFLNIYPGIKDITKQLEQMSAVF